MHGLPKGRGHCIKQSGLGIGVKGFFLGGFRVYWGQGFSFFCGPFSSLLQSEYLVGRARFEAQRLFQKARV